LNLFKDATVQGLSDNNYPSRLSRQPILVGYPGSLSESALYVTILP